MDTEFRMTMRMAIEAMQTHEFYAEANGTIGPKKVAAALHVTSKHVYRLGQPEEADGVRNDMDRLIALIDVLGAHPHARPLLKKMRLYLEAQFSRVLDHDHGSLPITGLDYAREGGTAMKELAEFVETLDDPERMDTRKALTEGAEACAAVERLFRRVLAASMQQQQPQPVR